MAEPFQFDWTTAVPVDDEPQPSAPSTPTPPESVDAVMSATPFGAQNMPRPQQGPVDAYEEFDWKTAEPLDGGFDPSSAREATPAEDAEFYEQINSTAYLPTKDEWRWRENFRKQRDDKVTRFIEGGKAMAGGLVQAAAATAFAPFDFLRRGTVAYDEWVNSSAEGVRQTGIATAELWSWAGDVIADRGKEIERNAALDAKLRQQLASENRFTGNAETDGQVFLQAREAAMASGFYDKTPEELTEDEDTQYQRFIRDRSFQQQAENITETNIGTLPDGRAEMGIDESKLNPGLVTTTQLIADPLNIAAGGLGIFSKVRPLRRAAALAGKPLELGGKAAGAAAQKADELYAGIVEGIEGATGLDGAQQMSALQNPITWKAAAAMGTLKGAGGILRTGQTWLDTGSIFVREAGTGGVGVARVEAAGKLRTAPIPERYRRAYDGFFTSADSTLRRVSETPGLSPVARRSAATLDRVGATQAFRVADDAIGGALATTPIAVPLAAISPEERQPEMLGGLMTVGAVGGVVGGKVRRVAESDDALVAKMLADVEISGGDATSMANMLSHDKLLRMAQMQTVMSAKADFVPLRANDYELNPTVTEHMGKNSRGFYVDATKGQRPRVFVNLDKLATGDVVGHEIGHAILKSDILGGQIKQGMRSVVDAQYGADGIAARGREYVKAQLTQEVNHRATGIEIEVLTPEESQRKTAGASMDELVADRWKSDPTWREQQINERVDLLNQEALGKGELSFDWARDEIVAETFSGLGKGINVAGLRASGPIGRTLGAMQTAMETMGARFTGSGKLESPNRLFTENPLFDTPQMRKAVNNYVKLYDRYLVGLEKEGKVKQRGRPIAPTGRPEEAARSPHTRTYDNNGVLESELFIERPDGTRVPKSQQMIDTQEKARAATLKSINNRTRFVDENSSEWGARKLSNGRIEVGGPNLPPQFDYFVQVPQWLRSKAREFEAERAKGRSYLYSYNAIGTGEAGSYKIKNLGNVEAKTGEMVPFGWSVSTKNHLLAKVIDLNSFRAAAMRAIDKGQLGEFGNNLRTVEADLKQLMRNHEEGRPGETGLGVTKKNILNGLLGTGTVTQRLNNQAWHTLNNQGSIRTFRFDRLNYADQFDTGYFPHYQKININALPDDAGRMSLDEYMRFDADRQAAWLNKRARERGYTNSTNWANSDEAGFAAASDEYRKLFPRPDNNNRMPSALPQAGMAMPDVAVERLVDSPTETPLQDTYRVRANKPLYRTVSLRDWERIAEQGFLDSDQRGAVSASEGANFATTPEVSKTYAPKDDYGVVLEIEPDAANWHGYNYDHYVRTWDKIPLNKIKVVERTPLPPETPQQTQGAYKTSDSSSQPLTTAQNIRSEQPAPMPDADEVLAANRTARAAGAVGARAITPRYVAATVRKGETVLNFGAGKPDPTTGKYGHSESVRAAGGVVDEFDFGANAVGALGKQYDTVMASNVLNVQSGRDMLRSTLSDIAASSKARAVMNYPESPRYLDLSADEVAAEIRSVFGAEPKIVGGTKRAPLWEVTKQQDAARGQAMPDVIHDDNYTLSPQVPDRGYYIIGTKPTADGRVLEYHVDPRTTLQPRVAGIDSISGEQVAMLEADRHNTRGDNMGGPLHPFLINNQTVVYLPDGRGYKPVWANMNSGFVTRAKNIVKNTTSGHALIQIMKENAHRSNRKFVMDVTAEIDARRASMSDDQADFLHVLLELGAINPQGRINQAYNRVKRLSDEALENRAPMSELAEAQRQYDVTFEKYGPMAEFLTRMGPLKNHSTRGRMKEFQGEFDSLMSKYRNAPWFSSMASKYRNTKFVDEAARFSFKQRGAAMDRITGIPFAPDVKKMLDDSMDFVNGKNLDIVGVVQLSKDADAFAVYFGKNAKEEAKMSANERLLRDQLLASGTFRPHPSYDWVMLGPENADSFILKTPADPLKLFPDYAKNHPNPKVRGGSKETIAGTMKKSKIPLILK